MKIGYPGDCSPTEALESLSKRGIVLQCSNGDSRIDTLRCSRCEWSYRLQQPKDFSLAVADAEAGYRVFFRHKCEVKRTSQRAVSEASPPRLSERT